MIRYALKCPIDHEFEAWFSSSSGFDDQVSHGQVECPMCGATAIRKAIMSPSVRASREAPSLAAARREVAEAMHRLRRQVEATHDYVGPHFATEARDMHDGATPERLIYGEATAAEVRELVDDGVPVAALPVFNLPDGKDAGLKAPAPGGRSGAANRRLN